MPNQQFTQKKRGKPKSEYGQQFQEKQDVKRSYELRETQFRNYFKAGATPEAVFQLLERRFDNVVYRAGFTNTRKFSRQLISHGHFQVNGKNLNIPSYQVNVGDAITVHPSSLSSGPFKDMALALSKYEPPMWIALDAKNLSFKMTSLPKADDMLSAASIKPIIEFYSR